MPAGRYERQFMIHISAQRRHVPARPACGKQHMQGVWGRPAHPARGTGAAAPRIHDQRSAAGWAGHGQAAAARLAPWVDVLPADHRAGAIGRQAHATELIAVQVGHGVGGAVAHGDGLAVEGVIQLTCAAGDLLPDALEIDRRDGWRAADGLGHALAVGTVRKAMWPFSVLTPSAVQRFACRSPARRAAGSGRAPRNPRPGASPLGTPI
jgi:hypothetical protein